MISRIFKWKRARNTIETKAEPKYRCPVCKKGADSFLPLPMHYFENMHRFSFKHNIFLTETINFPNFICPQCQASDRDRLYVLYLDNWLRAQSEAKYFLEIGPSQPLRNYLKAQMNSVYRCADLFREDVDDRVDITQMSIYHDGQFDFIICSHVLEHIPDDKKAIQELYRILKPKGEAIIMVPINLGVAQTEEDPDCTDIPTRWHRFGQDDHIRMYNKQDFIQRLSNEGFVVEQLGEAHFGNSNFELHAIFPTSVLYICKKNK
jgi:SAM-dependent methyltransferase